MSAVLSSQAFVAMGKSSIAKTRRIATTSRVAAAAADMRVACGSYCCVATGE